MAETKRKITVLLVSFALFIAGVWALYHESAPWRPWVLWGSFSLLGLIALGQTAVNWKKGK